VVGGAVREPDFVLEGFEKVVFPNDEEALVTIPPLDEVGVLEQMSPTVIVKNSVMV
jgi:hypothetical protein